MLREYAKYIFPLKTEAKVKPLGLKRSIFSEKRVILMRKKMIEIETWWKVNKVDYELPAPPSPGFPGSKLRGISRSTHTTLTQGVFLKFIKLSKYVTLFIAHYVKLNFILDHFKWIFIPKLRWIKHRRPALGFNF